VRPDADSLRKIVVVIINGPKRAISPTSSLLVLFSLPPPLL
jgi:hypothetical protein